MLHYCHAEERQRVWGLPGGRPRRTRSTVEFPAFGIFMDTAELYRLTKSRAATVLAEVRAAVGQWRAVAQRHGLRGVEVERMERVFQG